MTMSAEIFCGKPVSEKQIQEIIELTEMFSSLSRTELAATVCELFSWNRPNGKLKTVECRQFLDRLNENGVISLPERRNPGVSKTPVKRTRQGQRQACISGPLKELVPIRLKRVESREQRELWYEYIDRYHYLGFKKPFGAQLRYFIESVKTGETLGCFQFSSPAWRMKPRDQWIGWTEEQRKKNLQKIINNSRFLILPWVQVKNLASMALSIAVKQVPFDWQECFGYRPVLMETLVDGKRFSGVCYKAANFLSMGQTTGRGRMDRNGNRYGEEVKDIYVYPFSPDFCHALTCLQ